MVIVRIINPVFYDERLSRYQKPAFTPSGKDGGISILSKDCIESKQRTICNHIREFYITDEEVPVIFWEFNSEILPPDHEKRPEPGPSGDECHSNLYRIGEGARRRLIKNADWSEFKICNNGEHRELTREEAISLRKEATK